MIPPKYKEYLGDSVYVEFEHDIIKLYVDNGNGPTEVIYLEWRTWSALKEWVRLLDLILEKES